MRCGYIIKKSDHEIVVGTLGDLKVFMHNGTKIAACKCENELFHSIKEYRKREWIITIISHMPEFQSLWNATSIGKFEQSPVYMKEG